jgi:hypothetical protein
MPTAFQSCQRLIGAQAWGSRMNIQASLADSIPAIRSSSPALFAFDFYGT